MNEFATTLYISSKHFQVDAIIRLVSYLATQGHDESIRIRLTTLIYRMSVGTAAATRRKLDAKSRADQVTIGMAVTPMNLDQLY